jgi:hypothetical protein
VVSALDQDEITAAVDLVGRCGARDLNGMRFKPEIMFYESGGEWIRIGVAGEPPEPDTPRNPLPKPKEPPLPPEPRDPREDRW